MNSFITKSRSIYHPLAAITTTTATSSIINFLYNTTTKSPLTFNFQHYRPLLRTTLILKQILYYTWLIMLCLHVRQSHSLPVNIDSMKQAEFLLLESSLMSHNDKAATPLYPSSSGLQGGDLGHHSKQLLFQSSTFPRLTTTSPATQEPFSNDDKNTVKNYPEPGPVVYLMNFNNAHHDQDDDIHNLFQIQKTVKRKEASPSKNNENWGFRRPSGKTQNSNPFRSSTGSLDKISSNNALLPTQQNLKLPPPDHLIQLSTLEKTVRRPRIPFKKWYNINNNTHITQDANTTPTNPFENNLPIPYNHRLQTPSSQPFTNAVPLLRAQETIPQGYHPKIKGTSTTDAGGQIRINSLFHSFVPSFLSDRIENAIRHNIKKRSPRRISNRNRIHYQNRYPPQQEGGVDSTNNISSRLLSDSPVPSKSNTYQWWMLPEPPQNYRAASTNSNEVAKYTADQNTRDKDTNNNDNNNRVGHNHPKLMKEDIINYNTIELEERKNLNNIYNKYNNNNNFKAFHVAGSSNKDNNDGGNHHAILPEYPNRAPLISSPSLLLRGNQRSISSSSSSVHNTAVCDANAGNFKCPSLDSRGMFICVVDSQLCDGNYDCPLGEDEDGVNCFFRDTLEYRISRLLEIISDMKK